MRLFCVNRWVNATRQVDQRVAFSCHRFPRFCAIASLRMGNPNYDLRRCEPIGAFPTTSRTDYELEETVFVCPFIFWVCL